MRRGKLSVPGIKGRGRLVLGSAGGGAAPATPTGLGAIAGDSQVTLLWSSTGGASSYHLRRSTSPTGPFTSVLSSPSSAGYVDMTAVNGTTYYYVVSALNAFGESGNSSVVSATPAVVDVGGPLVISAMGDSITGDQGWGNPFSLVPALLSTALGGRSVTLGYNAQHNGYSTGYYLDPTQASLLDSDIAAMVSVGTTHCQLMFGANDQRFDILTTKEEFWSNLTTLMNRLNAVGITAILHYPTYVQPGSFSEAFTQAGADLLETYIPGMRALTNGTTKIVGDVTSYVNFRSHPELTWTGDTSNSGLHPTNVVTENPGVMGLAIGWVNGWVQALRTLVTLAQPINEDGSLNVSAWRAYYDSWNVEAWSQRMGGASSIADSDIPSLFTPPKAYGNRVYDFLGTGVGPYAIDGSILAVPHYQDIHQMGVAGQINPRTYGPPNPSIAPTLGNFNLGLPPEGVLYPIPGFPDNICLQNIPGNAQWWLQQTGTRGDPASGYWSRFGAGDFNSDFNSIHYISPNVDQTCGVDQTQTSADYQLCRNFIPLRNAGGYVYDATTGSNYQLYNADYRRGNPYGSTTFPAGSLLGYGPKYPISLYREPFENCEEAMVIDKDGIFTTLPGPTTRPSYWYPVPAYKFPDGERPYKLTMSSMAEYAAILVQDLNRNVSKVVVFALQGAATSDARHSMIYTGLGNEGACTKIVRVGEFDTGVKFPTSVSMGCDSALPETPELYGNALNDQGTRDQIRDQSGERALFCAFARKGFIAVASEHENKVEVWDISAYIESVFQGYMVHDQTAFEAKLTAMDAGSWPASFDGTDLAPTLINTWSIDRPSCFLASGNVVNSTTGAEFKDHDKLLVGSRSGLVTVLNTSPIMDRIPLRQYSTFNFDIYGSFQVGNAESNITEMCWSKQGQDANYSKVAATGVMKDIGDTPCEYLNLVHICCRGDRAIYSVCTRFDVFSDVHVELGVVYRTIRDKRIKDPVGIAVSTRSFIMQVADFMGQQVHSIQVGGSGYAPITDSGNGGAVVFGGASYPANPDDGTQECAWTGSVITGGYPISSTANNIQ